jgi:hypothetical protein
MWKRISDWLHQVSNSWVALSALAIFLLFSALVLPGQAARAETYTKNAGSPDMSFYYSADDLYHMAEVYGKQGREAYVRTRFTFDLIFPLVYTMFLGTAISWVYGKAFMPDSRWQRANLIPVLGALFDYLENLSTSLVMLRYPNQTGVVDVLAPVFTLAKWAFISGSFVLLLGGVVVGVWQRNKRRDTHHRIGRYDRIVFSARGKTLDYEGRIPWDITPADAIPQAYAHWQSGDLSEAGLILYERVPRKLRPAWAAHILRAASKFVPQTPEIEAVLAFAERPDKWGDGTKDPDVP